jgi:hypothetical protein
MALPDENKNAPPIAGRLEPTSIGVQIKALNQLLQKPVFTEKRAASENREQQLTIEINSLAAENLRLAEDLERTRKELAKHRALVIKTQEEVKATIAGMEKSLRQLQTENKNLKSELNGERVLLRIPCLKLKIISIKPIAKSQKQPSNIGE